MYIKKELEKELKEYYFRNYNGKSWNYEEVKFILSEDKHAQELISDIDNNTTLTRTTKKYTALRNSYENKISNYLDKFAQVHEIIDLLSSKSKESYIVGGSVRDIILGNHPKDFDFVTDITYDDMTELFSNAGYVVKEEGKNFLVMIITKNGVQYEIANFRKDGTYLDGSRPEFVEIGTIFDDSSRRDFTINALYYNVCTNELKDPTGQGILDIKDKILRFVGNPNDRLQEDALRAWRFLRFLDKLRFEADKKSVKSIKANFDEIYKRSNPQRVLQELSKFMEI